MFETPVEGVPMPLPFPVRDLVGIRKISNGILLLWSKNLDSLLSFVGNVHNPPQAHTAVTPQDPFAAGSIRPPQKRKFDFQNMMDPLFSDSCRLT